MSGTLSQVSRDQRLRADHERHSEPCCELRRRTSDGPMKAFQEEDESFAVVSTLISQRVSTRRGLTGRNMGQGNNGGQDSSQESAVRNDLSGQVDGPVVQARDIYGDVNLTVDRSLQVIPDEELSEELRKSSQIWRARFSSVDYVNLPRMPMLSAGGAVMAAAKRAGLDGAKPFQGQGFGPGEFVRTVTPLFEIWDAEAIMLNESTIGKLCRGVLVSFEALMRCRNAPDVPLRASTGDLAKDPHLVFSVGDHRVILSFDPRWLTTSTANTTLHDAVRNPQVFSGLGQVASIFEDGSVRISALVYGQPQSHVQAQLEYGMEAELREPVGLTGADFRNELSAQEQWLLSVGRNRREKAVERFGVALFFDEDGLLPGQADRVVLAQALRVVPEYRRDLGVAVASLLIPKDITVADVAAHLLARSPALWKTFTVPGLITILRSRNVAIVAVSGITAEQASDLDEVMRREATTYLGGIEIDWDLRMHSTLFPAREQYHLVGSELRLRYSAESRAIAEANGEDLGAPLEEWLEEELFESVVWEEDKVQSSLDEYYAGLIVRKFLEDSAE